MYAFNATRTFAHSYMDFIQDLLLRYSKRQIKLMTIMSFRYFVILSSFMQMKVLLPYSSFPQYHTYLHLPYLL